MENKSIIKEQVDWIKSGAIGCVFASALVKQREKIGWEFQIQDVTKPFMWDIKSHIVSLIFPNSTMKEVRNWALKNGFYIEDINDFCEGLRVNINADKNVSWVQYFGKDSHVKTRQSPYPMLSLTVKLPTHVYAKTMAKGIYHLAHASIEFLSAKVCDTLWNQSFIKTKKELGHSPNISEAAKTTFIK